MNKELKNAIKYLKAIHDHHETPLIERMTLVFIIKRLEQADKIFDAADPVDMRIFGRFDFYYHRPQGWGIVDLDTGHYIETSTGNPRFYPTVYEAFAAIGETK